MSRPESKRRFGNGYAETVPNSVPAPPHRACGVAKNVAVFGISRIAPARWGSDQ
jgi:hypothetical protein